MTSGSSSLGTGRRPASCPFCATGYREITVVNLSGTTPQMIADLDNPPIRPDLVFTYSVDTFMNDPSITNVLDAK